MRLTLKSGRLFQKTLPVLVWLSAVAGVAVLFLQQGAPVDFTGMAIAQEQMMTVAESGYIKSIPVQLYQEVKKGDTLAVVQISTVGMAEYDTTLIESRRATAQAELEHLKAELAAMEAEFEAEQIDRNRDTYEIQRRLAVDVEQARLGILQIKTDLEPGRSLLKDLELEVRIAEDLFKDNAIESYEVQKIKSECEVARQTVQTNEGLLAQAEEHYAHARLRLEEFTQSAPLPALLTQRLEPFIKAVSVQEKLLNEFIRPNDTVVLTAPFDGVVSNLLYKPGQAVMRDIPIMTIVKPAPDYVAAWVSQRQIRRLQVDMPIHIITRNNPPQMIASRIVRISPSIEPLPERMWQSPGIPEWGQVVIIPIQAGTNLVPNEIVGIKGT
ncbi:MAG: efflux RND transporter periplasmic adaptor subunit [Planctomycetales bacterium]|nr:efflux RND transporter periplasmic adaptor subunit [Planctomycetales bacterium]